MTDKKYDVVGIGNAIVDVLSYKDEAFLQKQNMPKGSMTLIDKDEAEELYSIMGAATECAGGSTANTLAGISLLGGKTLFIGNVRHDHLGRVFRRSLHKVDVDFDTPDADDGDPTAQCMIFVTEEESKFGNPAKVERTMATYLGSSGAISEEDIDEKAIKEAKLLYFEGYLWDNRSARGAIRKAISIAKDNNTKVSFTLSDSFCVERHRNDFLDLIENDVDILFANEAEIKSLLADLVDPSTDARKMLYFLSEKRKAGHLEIAVITRSEKGSYVLSKGNEIHTIKAEVVKNVYDVTGAGDLYASGFLYGYLNDFAIDKSGKLGSLCASEVIKYIGARPLTKLSELLDQV